MTKKVIYKKLKEPDEFITLSEKSYRFITRNYKPVLIAVAVILAVFLLVFSYLKDKKKDEIASSRMFDKAMEAYQMARSPYQETSSENERLLLGQFDQIINKYPRTSSGKFSLLYKGDIQFRLKEFDEAVKSFEAFLNKAGGNKLYHSLALNGLGYCYEGKNEYEKALGSFKKIVELGESSQMANGYLGEGRCYEKLGKNKEAIENYKNFLKVSQKSHMENMVLEKIANLEGKSS